MNRHYLTYLELNQWSANPARWRFLPVQPSDCSPFGL